MAEIDAERAREARRRVLEEAAQVCANYEDQLEANGVHLAAIAARTCYRRIRALIDKEPSRD